MTRILPSGWWNKSCLLAFISADGGTVMSRRTALREADSMEKTVSLRSLLVEKYSQLLDAAKRRDMLTGGTQPIPVVVRTAPPRRVPVSRRRRVYP